MHLSKFCPPPPCRQTKDQTRALEYILPPEQGNLTYKLNIKQHTFQLTV